MPKKSKTISIEEVASKLNVTTRTVQNWITRGLITQTLVKEKSLRIRRFEFHELLNNCNS